MSAAYRGEAPHLLAETGMDLSNIRSGALSAAINAGDAVVERIVIQAARRIGWALAGVVNLLAPDILLLGGGLVKAMPHIFSKEVNIATNDRVMPAFRGSFKVVVAGLGDQATATGAAAWARASAES